VSISLKQIVALKSVCEVADRADYRVAGTGQVQQFGNRHVEIRVYMDKSSFY